MKTWKFESEDSLRPENMPDWVLFLWQNWRIHFDKTTETLKLYDVEGHCEGELHYTDILLCPDDEDKYGNKYPLLRVKRGNRIQYYKKNYDTQSWDYIPLTNDNMWYVQLDASINFVFQKYNMTLPTYVMIDEFLPKITIKIVRPPMTTFIQVVRWEETLSNINDDLKTMAEVNSSVREYHDISYKFEII